MASVEETQLLISESYEAQLNNNKNYNETSETSTIKETVVKQTTASNNTNDNVHNDEFLMSNYCLRLNHDIVDNNDNSKTSLNDSYNADKSLYEPNNSSLESNLVYPLKIGLNKIGRAELNHIIILNKNISKNHACIELKENESGEIESCFLWDVGSLNKTRLNNHVLKANEKSKIEIDDIIEFNLVNFTFSKMTECERIEQGKNRSYFIELNKVGEQENGVKLENGSPNKNNLNNSVKKNGGFFEIQNTLDENVNETVTAIKTNISNPQHYKLHMADTDEEDNIQENDKNEKSSIYANNTSGGTDFHLEMSQSILQPNQSTISTNKSMNQAIPDTIIDENQEMITEKTTANEKSETVEKNENEELNGEKKTEENLVAKINEENIEFKPTVNQESNLKNQNEEAVEEKVESNQEIQQMEKTIPAKVQEKAIEEEHKSEQLTETDSPTDNVSAVEFNKEDSTKILSDEKNEHNIENSTSLDLPKCEIELEKKSEAVIATENNEPKLVDKIDQQILESVEPSIPETTKIIEIANDNQNSKDSQIINNDETNNVAESVKPEEKPEEEKLPATNIPRRGRRSVKGANTNETLTSENELQVQDDQKSSDTRPRRSIRTVLPPPPLQLNATKRKSTNASQQNREINIEENKIEKIISENNKPEDEIINENNDIKQDEPESNDKKEENTLVENEKAQPLPEKIKQQVSSTTASTSGLTRRSSLRIRSNVVTNQPVVGQANEKLKKATHKEKIHAKVEETLSEENKTEPKVALKRGRKSIVTQDATEAETVNEETNVKKPRGAKSIDAKSAEKTNEMKPPAQPISSGRQPRANRRTTIAVLPEQVQEAKQKLAIASRSKARVAAGPLVVQNEAKVEAPTTNKKRSGSNRAASSDTNNKKSRKSTNQQPKVDTYLYDEIDNNDDQNLNSSSTKRKNKTTTIIDAQKIESKSINKNQNLKKRAIKKNNLNASLNLNTQKTEEDESDVLSKTLPFSTKLFFHSKKRKTLPAGTSIGIVSNETNAEPSSESNNYLSKRYSYSTLSSKNSNNNINKDEAIKTVQVSNTSKSGKKNSISVGLKSPNRKFKLHQDKSSSSENESESESESLTARKLKQSTSSKAKIKPQDTDISKDTEKKGTIKRRPTLKRSEVVESIVSNTAASSRSSRNKKVSTAIPKIMATGIILNEKQKQIIANLGGELVTDPKESTHLITNKIRKSCKFLSCLNKGCYIVNERWLEESNKAKTFANPSAYALTDTQCEKQNKFSLEKSLLKAKSQSLFQDWKFVLIHEDSPQEELSRSDLKTIIECGNGELIDELPNDEQQSNKCCILYTNLVKYKNDTKYAEKSNLCKMTLDTFLNSILKQLFDTNHKIDACE